MKENKQDKNLRDGTKKSPAANRKRFTQEADNPMGTAFDKSAMSAGAGAKQLRNVKSRKTTISEDKNSSAVTQTVRKDRTLGKTSSVETQSASVGKSAAVGKKRAQTSKKRILPPRDSDPDFAMEWENLLNDPEQETPKKIRTEKKRRSGSDKKNPVKIIFLGGVGEIGKNMTALEYLDDIIVIDAGLTFPNGEDMPGVDSVVPDVTYLVQNRDKIRGILLTHGHEDHIGGVPYLMKELNANIPIYGTKLTLMLTDNKLQEQRIQNTTQRVVKAGDRVKLGAFEVEFINVNHSISGACALAIRTPNGLIYHSGDFKIDLTPVAGAPIDLSRIAELGKEGVLLCMSESTNIERPGFTMSETVVGTTLDHLFSENTNRRLIIATFASNVHRLQQIIDLAVKYRRKVALSGRSMFKVVDAAVKIGELKIPEGILIDIEKTKNLFDGELVIVSTGSQGEPMSALTRMASGDFNKVTIGPNDTIIISATPIPGNEKMVYRVINNLYKKGARVKYNSLEKIHVSGHACEEEQKILYTLLRPKFFIPVHGEYRHLKRHAQLVENLGMPEQNILITEIGSCVELTENSLKFGESVQAGTRLIDGEGVEDYGTSEVMKDRLKMSADGVFAVALAVTGNYIINDPVIESHGCVFAGEDADDEMRSVVQRAVDAYDYENGSKDELVLFVRKYLKNYFYKKTKQAPLIIVSVVEV